MLLTISGCVNSLIFFFKGLGRYFFLVSDAYFSDGVRIAPHRFKKDYRIGSRRKEEKKHPIPLISKIRGGG